MGGKKMTKNDLVEAIYFKSDCEKYLIQDIVEKLLKEVKKSLESGASIELRGFGTFEPRLRKGREVARNPKTGETLSVAPHYVAAFRAGQDMREKIARLEIKEKAKK